MLSCQDVANRASDLIDGELSAWEMIRMRMHLAMCKGCSGFIDQLRTTDRLTAMIAKPANHLPDDTDNAQFNAQFAEVLSMLNKEKQ